jgi:hypothetical protein
MKKALFLTSLVVAYAVAVFAQQTYTYRFNGNFTESSGNGPTLTPLGTGQFAPDTLLDFNLYQNVYHFDANCGFSFTDASNFISSGSYTIEVYFKLSNLSSWKRVIDFKDRTSDKGCYVYNGQMNFYNLVTSTGTAPFQANEYSHYVITRDAATKKVILYGDGDKYVSFTDNSDDAVYGSNKKLNFFQDDLVVGNEAANGAIALLKIHNYTMDSAAVKTSYTSLSGALTGIKSLENNAIPLSIYPNPATENMTIALPETNEVYSYQIVNALGKVLVNGTAHSGKNNISISTLTQGVYIIVLHDNKGNRASQRILKK